MAIDNNDPPILKRKSPLPEESKESSALTKKISDQTSRIEEMIKLADQQLKIASKIDRQQRFARLLGFTGEESAQENAPLPKNKKAGTTVEPEERDWDKPSWWEEKLKKLNESSYQTIKKTTENSAEITTKNLVAPLGVLNDSIANLTGFDASKFITDKMTGLLNPEEAERRKMEKRKGTGLFGTGKDFKKPVNRENVKKVDPGAVLVADTISKSMGSKPGAGEEGAGDLGAMAGLGGLGSMLGLKLPKGLFTKAVGVAGIAAGILWGIVDGIAAVGKAEDWGVSKISAGLGGFFAGAGEGGMKDAFKNAGKWALVGAGVGTLIMPGVGTLAGGLIGAAFGGILGFIGGKNLSKGFDKLGAWFKDIWESDFVKKIRDFVGNIGTSMWNMIKAPFDGLIKSVLSFDFGGLKEIWDDPDSSIGKKIGESVKEVAKLAWTAVSGFVTGAVNGAIGWLKDLFVGDESEGKKSLLGQAGDIIKDILGFVKDFFSGMFDGMWKEIKGSPIFKSVSDFLGKYIVDPIVGFFNQIGDFFAYIGSYFSKGFFEGSASLGKDILSGDFTKRSQTYANARELSRLRASGELEKWAKADSARATRGGFYDARGALNMQKVALAYAAAEGMALPTDFDVFKKYHTGGLAGYEQMAILRKDEQVLSPYQSRMYRDMTTKAELSLREDLAETEREVREMQMQTSAVLVTAVKELVAVMKEGKGGNVSNAMVQNNMISPFNAGNLMQSLTMETA